ncbi:hypothetical protein HZS_3460 [Henneguya salminicola]|nr:hypothetical protein HZS_3460 [Henneguya salminicola]
MYILFKGYFHRKTSLKGRSLPLFFIRLWNRCERTLNKISRTNNMAEGWRNAFAHLNGENYPNI